MEFLFDLFVPFTIILFPERSFQQLGNMLMLCQFPNRSLLPLLVNIFDQFLEIPLSQNSKVAKEFVVSKYIAPPVLEIVDPDQWGYPMHALISIIHQWAQASNGTGSTIGLNIFFLITKKLLT